MRHRGRSQRSLSVTADPQNGTLGKKGLYTHSAATFSHAEASVQIRDKSVSFDILLWILK